MPTVGRAVPLAFLLAAVGGAAGRLRVRPALPVLPPRRVGVRVRRRDARAADRRGRGLGLLGTYTFYGVVTSSAAGIFGAAFLTAIGIWQHPPTWAPFLLVGLALVVALVLTISPARRGTACC